jgi:phytoene dehydrogenase-like protein
MADITVIGGGLAGMVAAIAAAEQGAKVYLYEAHQTLGGRARSTPPPFVANDGPHALYDNGALWPWLADRDLIARPARVPLGALAGFWFRWQGRLRHRPPAAVLRLLAKRDRHVPVDRDFHGWVAAAYGEQAATAAANLLGVATFDADPGRLSAAFAWERLLRVFGQLPPAARYPIGGWGAMVARMQARARQLGVVIQLGARVERLPDPPVIVATSLEAARRLLGDDTLRWDSGRAVLLDVGLRRRRGDAFVISDLDEAGWAERFTAPDPTLAPPGHSLVQAQLPLRPGEGGPDGLRRLERLLELGYPGWRERLLWRRHGMANGRTGALDLPGRSWRDRPAVDRGEGVFLAGDMVAAPGLLSEVAFHSALDASRGALRLTRPATPHPMTYRPRPRTALCKT